MLESISSAAVVVIPKPEMLTPKKLSPAYPTAVKGSGLPLNGKLNISLKIRPLGGIKPEAP